MEEYSRSTTHKSIQGCVLVLMNVLAICGNIFVCWVIYRKRKTLAVPYLYVLALAVSDLMVAICCFPFCVQAFLEDGWIHGYNLCQFNGFLIYYWGGISVPTLALTAVNRFFRVVKSHIYPNYFTIKSSAFMIFAVWLLTILDGFLSTFAGPVIYKYDPRFFFCIGTFSSKKHERAIGISLHLIHVFIPLVIIVYCYANVFRTVRQHNANVAPVLRPGQHRQLAINAWEIRVTKLLFLVVLGFFVCWIPVMVIGLLAHSSTVKLPALAPEMYSVLALASAVINPFIYGVANQDFRREFLGFFQWR